MFSKETIAYLKLLHGLYNSIVIVQFIYQGILGLKIRRERKSSNFPEIIIKRHRILGPILTVESIMGFFAGITLVFVDYGFIFKYPLHFITGLFIILSVITTFFISRKIKADASLWRELHFRLGILILFLYVIQAFFGLGILL
ncbi:MAG: DUF4079 domain-containing protein [Thermodesulfovibrionales bacterium]|nr:DUF4079 domain-containing protein [Thermodesulfovibrionales bacterium]